MFDKLVDNQSFFFIKIVVEPSFLVSIAQSLINRGSKYWQERWEYKAKNRESKAKIDITLTELKFDNGEEKNYIDACILDKGESFFTRAQRFSVSKLTFLVWDIISIATLFLWIKDVCLIFETKVNANTYVYLFHGIVILYIFLFFCTGKLYQKLKGGALDPRDYIENKNPK